MTRAIPPLRVDALVVGSGLSGSYAAWLLAQKGMSVAICGKGTSASEMSTGCLDFPDMGGQLRWADQAEMKGCAAGCQADIIDICSRSKYAVMGEYGKKAVLVDQTGLPHRTNLAPRFSFHDVADLADQRLKVMEPSGVPDLSGAMFSRMASSWTRSSVSAIRLGAPTSAAVRDIRATGLGDEAGLDGLAAEMAGTDADVLVVPPLFGLRDYTSAMDRLERSTGKAVLEPLTPLSLPGRRLAEAFGNALKETGAIRLTGHRLVRWMSDGGSVRSVFLATGSREREVRAAVYVYCGGGLIGGGLEIKELNVDDPLGFLDVIKGVDGPPHNDPTDVAMEAGLRTDDGMHAYHEGGRLDNVTVAGSALPGQSLPLGFGMGAAMMTARIAVQRLREAGP